MSHVIKSIKDLKKGDIVTYYNALFLVTEDAKPSKYTHGVYVAPCQFQSGGSDYLNDILTRYDYFQGTEHVEHAVVNN